MSDSLCTHFQRRVARNGHQPAVRNADGTVAYTWAQYGAQVRELAAGLVALGVRSGDTVGIMLTNRPEFHLVDAAVMHLGAVGFSIYNTSSVNQIAYLLGNAAPRVLVTESQFLERIREATTDRAISTVCVDATEPDTIGLDEMIASADPGFDFDAAWQSIGRDDVLTLIYTSGTTGNPKGVELTHGNLLYQLGVVEEIIGDLTAGRVVSYLPDAHLINRWLCQYAPMYFGMSVVDVENPKTLIDVLPQVRPTAFAAVPMLWYKIKGSVETTLAAESGIKGALARWAVAAGRKKAKATIAGTPLGRVDTLAATLADKLVLSKLRAKLGLDAIDSAVSGAAPIDVAALEFMLALGIPVMEAWGMSETSAVTTVNPAARPKYGTVGKAIPGTDVKLAEDGEILVRGDGVMRGYRNDPDRTAEVLDGAGWIHTGDVGLLDNEGYLTIIDRKKELIINSGGKNMSPSNIEGALKAASPLVGSVAAIGDNRPYVTALITLDPDAAAAFADRHGIADPTPDTLAKHPEVLAALDEAVTTANGRLSRVEGIRRWKVLPTFWLPGGDELTPTMKLRRVPIRDKYAADIAALYER
ncbi:long-chain fatty acid--CoA ligase (plasmid) [Rhodococcus pyridinivorans]|uniref:AMP-dependent synthetase/ligase n=1 Tax=Rhodococcus TaxID=1827 RepID=UPI0007DA23AB|nr:MULTISPECIES: long-chain fatty acid--CoA ligase [Rhodococcus]MCT7293669.1 long-chain fatty acid--CoA ligase [Rhodococcus sp. PAE-6]QXU56451.1 long-chain fatty acid--CoA ligase [Rhodococcus sp. LW-XY12]UQB75821.1 long-chain fatty acid--CoA ligase [Rhodococcus ruber]UVT27510.1 long-chain fatty acid--CoA ligase [Rhodococcus pyridinivorans]WML66328.1 long-chain fatty acid--CoA ligase [Rhodococcus sp. AH-ZY2]